jgi:hypothetical protein
MAELHENTKKLHENTKKLHENTKKLHENTKNFTKTPKNFMKTLFTCPTRRESSVSIRNIEKLVKIR